MKNRNALRAFCKNTIILVISANAFFLCSCGSAARSGMKENNKQIPIGFGKEDVTILAVRKSSRYNKWLEKRFSENYFGKYLIIDGTELQDEAYRNTKIYRYIFDESETTQMNVVKKNSVDKSIFSESVNFSLTDRASGVVYKTYQIDGAPTAVMRDYLKAMEIVRKRNAPKVN